MTAPHDVSTSTPFLAPSLISEDRAVNVSFEFFPPKTEHGLTRLIETAGRLAAWNPSFVSVTCGADGSATGGTPVTVRALCNAFAIPVAPHIAMSRASRAELHHLLHLYQSMGVRHAVAIRGDAPRIPTPDEGEDYYQNTVDFVRDLAQHFHIEPFVGAYPDVHPLALSPQQDLDHLKRKIDAGATRAITQFFFEAETFLRFRDKVRASGITLPLTPGILPLRNIDQTLKFAATCGTIVPPDFSDRFVACGNDAEALHRASAAASLDLCERLRREGVAAFHFYTLNHDDIAGAVCEGLGLRLEPGLRQQALATT